ncbi:MAG: hypothetical protein NTW42_10085 [Deltaproteobacteria bacterium]|nr:hypothetical protein [Deltaproteobacteria bacterium]
MTDKIPVIALLGLIMDLNRYAPDDLLLKYLSIRTAVPDDVFYNKPMYRKVMEFWCAAQFARGYEKHVAPCAVWVHDGDAQTYFDFQLETKAQRQDFQLTEVLLPDRRRGDEYRTGGPKTRTTVEDWDRGEKDGGRWIAAAIDAKRQRVGGDVHELNLLVYINYPAVEHPYFDLQNELAQAAAPFRSVWLLNGHALACVSCNVRGLDVLPGWMFVPDDPEHEP